MYRSPFLDESRETTSYKKKGSWKCGYHTGIDRVCSINPTLVAIADGKIIRVNDCGNSYGNHVVIRITDKLVILYAHLRDKPTVKVGQSVKAGQKIGIMGNTGNSFGAHLHIEIQLAPNWNYNKNLANPNNYIDWEKYAIETSNSTKGADFMAKSWTNGSTPEKVYQTTADCKAQKNSIGSLNARETAECVAITDGCYLLTYKSGKTTKCGFVKYAGGVK